MKYSFKVALLGDTSVGKSSISLRACKDIFQDENVPTITAEFFLKRLESNNNIIDLLIWDTAGQERFNSIVPVYIRGAKILFFVFDLTRYGTLEHIFDNWLMVAKKSVNLEECVVYFLGNKCDLDYDPHYEFDQVIKRMEEHVPHARYFMVSAKDATNMDLLMHTAAIDVFDFYVKEHPTQVEDSNTIELLESDSKKWSCC